MTTTITTPEDLANIYRRVVDANVREQDDQRDGLPSRDPAGWVRRQAITDQVWARFTTSCHAAGLTVAEGIDAARTAVWGVEL